MPHNQATSVDDIHLGTILTAVKKAARGLLLAALAIGAATFAVLSMMTPKYTSQAQIEIVSKGLGNPFESRRDSPSLDMISVRMDKEAIGTHVRALQSSDLALKVAKELKLAARPEFNSALPDQSTMGRALKALGIGKPRPGETDDERVLRAFGEALRVYQIKDTRGIIVEFRSEDPALAAAVANRLAELYRDDLSFRAVQETEDARAKLGPQIRKLADEVGDAEAEVTRFRGQANIFEAGRERSGLNEQQLSELTAELTKAATARAEAVARADEAREIAAQGGGETLPDVQKSTLVPRLVEQRVRVERQIAELSATLLPAHPRMKQLTADLTGLNQQIKAEVWKVVEGLDREVKIAALREDGVRRRIDEAKTRVVSSGADDVRLRALESIAKSKRSELERLQAQLEAARTTADARAVPVEVQIISRARPTSEPASPRPFLVSLLVAFATAILGMAFVVMRELLAASQATASRPSAGQSPRAPFHEEGGVPVARVPLAPVPAFPTVPSMARYFISQARGKRGFRIAVVGDTAATPTGKIAMDLARQLSGQGRQTVLLDWGPDGMELAAAVATASAPGIGDVLAGHATLDQAVKQIPGTSALALGPGKAPAGAAMRDKDRINMLLDALDEAYEHIVIAGSYEVLSELFTTIEGRIDAGVVVADTAGEAKAGNFLGFHVPDLSVIRYEPMQGRSRPVMVPAPALEAAS